MSNYNGTNQFSGFVRDHEGKILNSYVDIEFNGSMHGLLVGENRGANTEVSNSYVIGNAMNARNTRSFMHTNKGSIENAYYAVKTSGGSAALLISNQGSISSSYYDNEKWGGTMRIVETTNSDGSDENSGGYSTMDLQMPTAANLDDMDSPYYQWSEDNWSFGTSEQYPLLKYGSGDDQANPACGNSQQPRCGTLLRGQESGQELSPDATLAALVLTDTSGEVTLTPVFASAMTNYTASVTETVDEVQVTPIATEGMVATIMIGNETVESGDSFDISLGAAGTNTDIEIVVTAPNGTTTNSYTVTVRRELSDDATLSFLTLTDRLSETPVTGDINSFSPDKLQYSARVLHTVSMVTVTVSATNGNAEIRVDSDEVESDTGFDVALGNPGSDTVIEIEVTAQDGMTTNTYTITVNRAETPALNDATLFDLALRLTDTDDTRIELSPAFASPRTSYNAGVADTVDTIAVTPTATNNNATITVTVDETEVETVVSGNASRPIDLTEGEGATTTITIVVTAQDGNTMRKYTIAVTRALPGIRVRVKVFLEGPLR
ncbi:MAG: cadherin-like beta sandwich domain-containing protein [Chromatiales bacterium]|nr:cadherin-like beta sandwich domain-containing protein [Chromatiales bacterium]